MEKLFQIIDKFKDLKILVIGDLMLDQYIHGQVSRISPEAPIPVLEMKKIYYTPGGAANAALNVRTLGGKVFAVGVIGPEHRGQMLKKALEERGISPEGAVVDPDRKTTLKERIVAKNQQIVRIDLEDRAPIGSVIEGEIIDFVKNKIKEVDAIIISDYAKGVITPNLSMNIISLARENNTLCHIDPKGKDYSKYRGCSIITPNEKELSESLNVIINKESQFLEAGKMLLSHVSSENVIVTRHSKGMVSFDKEGNYHYFPAVNRGQVVDVSGAGDTGIAAVTMALAAGAELEQAMAIASYACGVVVAKPGTATLSPDELKRIIKELNVKGKN